MVFCGNNFAIPQIAHGWCIKTGFLADKIQIVRRPSRLHMVAPNRDLAIGCAFFHPNKKGKTMKALFLGYGRMGSAIGTAWLNSQLVEQVVAIDPGLAADAHAAVYADAALVPSQAFDVIVVAVKPGMVQPVLSRLSDALCADAVVVSVAAGITLASLEQAIGGRCPVVRAMPNTPVLVGAGCTGLFGGNGLTQRQRESVGRLFATVGSAHWVEQEPQLDAVTALSGSGPAYYHLFSEALAQAGVRLGLPPELARRLAADTAFGAAALQRAPQADFAALRLAVTSSNGTTAAAIEVFEHDSALRELVRRAASAAALRSEALSRGE